MSEEGQSTEETKRSFPGWMWGLGGAIILFLLFLLYQFFGDNLNFAEKGGEDNTETPKQVEVSLPEPGEGETYFQFDVGKGTFNLILPEGITQTKLEVSPDEGFSVDLGENRILTIYFAQESTDPGEDCGMYTETMLGNFDYSSGYYRLNHDSGSQACVLNAQVSGNHVFELGLFWNGSTYEFQTFSTAASGGPYIPRGTLSIDGVSDQYIFVDGFESGDISSWSR